MSSIQTPALAPARTALLLSVALAAGAACRGDAGKPAPSPEARRYTVRGEVVRIAREGKAPQLSLRHEAIPDFADQTGRVVGMRPMVMPFDVAPDVRLDDVRPGDKVEARIAVGWSPPAMRVEQLRKLPPDTALTFDDGRAPGR